MHKLKDNNHIYTYLVDDLDKSENIKDYLMDVQSYSSRLIRKVKREGEVYLNGYKTYITDKVNLDDEIIVDIGKEYIDVEPENIPLDIIHEDDDILIINKQPGIVTHITKSHPSGTLANAIAYHWTEIGVNSKVRFVNRLDRDTSGIIVIAKNKFAHQFIQNEMLNKRTEKIYLAIVENIPNNKIGVINSPIGRPDPNSIMRKVIKYGKEAITHYKMIKKFKKHSLLEINLKTGRTHQIRVHLKSIGIPIIGDNLYNEGSTKHIKRQALHASNIEFAHPRSLKRVKYSAKLPKDLHSLIEVLEV